MVLTSMEMAASSHLPPLSTFKSVSSSSTYRAAAAAPFFPFRGNFSLSATSHSVFRVYMPTV